MEGFAYEKLHEHAVTIEDCMPPYAKDYIFTIPDHIPTCMPIFCNYQQMVRYTIVMFQDFVAMGPGTVLVGENA